MVDVEPDEIRRAAGFVNTAAEGINTHNPSAELSGIGSALPNGQASAAATALTTQWETRFPALHRDMTTHSTNLGNAADTWSATDGRVAGGYPSTP